jgi:hypothetical protein
LPIRELFTTTVLDSFNNQLNTLQPFTQERMVGNLRAEANYQSLKSRGATRRRSR